MEAENFNQLINTEIKSGKISAKTLKALLSANAYDSATSASWLLKKLKLISETCKEKQTTIETSPVIVLNDNVDFINWIGTNFPDFLPDFSND